MRKMIIKIFCVVLYLFLIGPIQGSIKEYNRDETFMESEPRGFFSKLDSESLSDRSMWNVKDTYLSRRGLMPAVPSRDEQLSSDSNVDKRSSIFRAKLLSDDDDDDEEESLQLTKREDIPKDDEFEALIISSHDRLGDESENEITAAYEKNTATADNKDDSSGDSSGDEGGVRRDFITSEDADEGVDSGSGSSEDEAPIDSVVDSSGSGEKEANSDESGSAGDQTAANTATTATADTMPEFKETARLYTRNDSTPSITITDDVNKRNLIPIRGRRLHGRKRQFITRPKFVVRNGYVYMKAPPLTQKTIVTTHIPRPPMMMPYNRFLHNYRRDREMAYGVPRRSRYMVPDRNRYLEADDNYEDDRGDESHCDGDPCMNGATCNEVRDGYECICPTGFKGTDCEEEDRCHPNPCRNNGVCTEANGQYVCTCAEGFKGTNCQEVNRCQPNPCHNSASCVETGSDFECLCGPEYMGKDCSEINHCHMTPCLNGGTCTTSLGINYAGLVNCLCLPGYSGGRCELRDKCHINPCKNGGMCHDGLCTCAGGYAGELCETPPSPCSLSTCLNGGTCLAKGLSSYKCICRHGFRGTNCEDESRCEPNPCLNGLCLDQEDGYKCECHHGYKGTHCEDEISPCDANPCLNDGNCIVEYAKYKCLCRPGYKGSNCEDLDRCHHRPCRNGGTCIATDDDVRCECGLGYKGLLCAETDHCTPSPCQNNGVCYENADSYTCQCNGGYKGVHCSDRDPCHLSPCNHNGLCIPEGRDDYRCECGMGWLGKSCDLQDKCHPNPCLHGGVCLSREPGSYECHCPSGYAGLDCEVEGFPGELHRYEDHVPAVASVPAITTGIPCRNTHYGCCPDGETAASGPSQTGCPVFKVPAAQEVRSDKYLVHHVPPHDELFSSSIPSHERERERELLELHHSTEEFHRPADDYREAPRPHSEETDWARRRSHYWTTHKSY